MKPVCLSHVISLFSSLSCLRRFFLLAAHKIGLSLLLDSLDTTELSQPARAAEAAARAAAGAAEAAARAAEAAARAAEAAARAAGAAARAAAGAAARAADAAARAAEAAARAAEAPARAAEAPARAAEAGARAAGAAARAADAPARAEEAAAEAAARAAEAAARAAEAAGAAGAAARAADAPARAADAAARAAEAAARAAEAAARAADAAAEAAAEAAARAAEAAARAAEAAGAAEDAGGARLSNIAASSCAAAAAIGPAAYVPRGSSTNPRSEKKGPWRHKERHKRRQKRRQKKRQTLETRLSAALMLNYGRPHTAAAAALSLLPSSPEPLCLFQGPLLDVWFLGFEVSCCHDCLSAQQVQQRLRGILGAPLLEALGAPSSLAFKSYEETRSLVLQRAGYLSQGPLCVAAAAEALEGQCLSLMDAVGKLLLLRLLHRRALKVYALYEEGPPRPLTEGALTMCLLKALAPSAAAAAADLLLVLQQQQQQQKQKQQQQQELSFEAIGNVLLRAFCGRKGPLGAPPTCSVSFPSFRCMPQGQPPRGPLVISERRGPLGGPLQPMWDEAPGALKRLEGPLGAPNEGPPEGLFSPPKRRRLAWVL
ncbi:hypothetical protein ACSSS7_000156 [Eimeria intestinalis]